MPWKLVNWISHATNATVRFGNPFETADMSRSGAVTLDTIGAFVGKRCGKDITTWLRSQGFIGSASNIVCGRMAVAAIYTERMKERRAASHGGKEP